MYFYVYRYSMLISAYTNYYTNTSHVFGIVGPAIMQKADPHTQSCRHRIIIQLIFLLYFEPYKETRAEYEAGRVEDGQIRLEMNISETQLRLSSLETVRHVQRRGSGYIGKSMLNMKLPARRKSGKSQIRFMDLVKEDLQRAGVMKEDQVMG